MVWIVNGSAQERLYGRIEGVAVDSLQARVYDRGLAQAATCLLPVADHVFTLDLLVEIGGAVELVAP